MSDDAILKFGDDHPDTTGTGDTIEFMKNRAGGLKVDIDEPWAGDSESGFGRSCSFILSKEQRRKLLDWLKQ